MASKQSRFANAFKDDAHLAPVAPAPRKAGNGRPATTGETTLVAANLPTRYGRTLRMMAAEEDTTLKALMEEAFNLLFAARGKS